MSAFFVFIILIAMAPLGYAPYGCSDLATTDPVDERFASYSFGIPKYGFSVSLPGQPENIKYEYSDADQIVLKNTYIYYSQCETVEYRMTVLDGGDIRNYSPQERKDFENMLVAGSSDVDPGVASRGSKYIDGRYFNTFVVAAEDVGGQYIRQGAYYPDWDNNRVYLAFIYYSRLDNQIDAARSEAFFNNYVSSLRIHDNVNEAILKEDQRPVTNLIDSIGLAVDLPVGWEVNFYNQDRDRNKVALVGKTTWLIVRRQPYKLTLEYYGDLANGKVATYLDNRVKQWAESEMVDGQLFYKNAGLTRSGETIYELRSKNSSTYHHSFFINGKPGTLYLVEPCQKNIITPYCKELSPEEEKEILDILHSMFVL